MKKTRLSLEKFGKQTIKKNMLDKVSGGYTISAIQESCHPGDPKNKDSVYKPGRMD